MSDISVYLAGPFTKINELREIAHVLNNLGFTVTSSWLHDEDHIDAAYMAANPLEARRTARRDLRSIRNSDVFVLVTEHGTEGSQGGMMVEFGYALALAQTSHRGPIVAVCGPASNLFLLEARAWHLETVDKLFGRLAALRALLADSEAAFTWEVNALRNRRRRVAR